MNESSGLSSTSGSCTCTNIGGFNGWNHLPGCPFYMNVPPSTYTPTVYQERGARDRSACNCDPTLIHSAACQSLSPGGKCCGHIKEHHTRQSVTFVGDKEPTTVTRCNWHLCGCPEWVE